MHNLLPFLFIASFIGFPACCFFLGRHTARQEYKLAQIVKEHDAMTPAQRATVRNLLSSK